MIQSLITKQLNRGYIYKHLRSKVMHYLKKSIDQFQLTLFFLYYYFLPPNSVNEKKKKLFTKQIYYE